MPPGIYPDWQKWERNTITWMERFELDREQLEAGRLRGIVAGELAGRTMPDAVEPPGAQFSTDNLMWLFAFDDAYCDEGRWSHDPAAMAILVADLIRIVETGRTTSASYLARALADLRCRLDGLTTPTATARWVHAMKGYLYYQIWEAAYRSTNTMPTIDQYAVARIRNGSMEVCAMTLDIAQGYEVPADEIDLPAVRALTEMACALVGWDNDIASYYKEHKRSKDNLNLVDVIAHERHVSPRAALPEAVALRDAVLTVYLRLLDQTTPQVAAQTRRYLGGLSAWIRGNLDWSAHTARYHRPDRPTIAVTSDPPAVPQVPPPPGIAWWWEQARLPVPSSG